jgi:hypothetical protein
MLEKAARKSTEKMDNREKGESEQKTKSPEKAARKRRKMTRETVESEQNTKCPEKAARKKEKND